MKTNRADRMGICSVIALVILFWVSTVCGILGHTGCIVRWAIVLYAISAAILADRFLDKRPALSKIIFFLMCVAMQLVPYAIILLIRGLFF